MTQQHMSPGYLSVAISCRSRGRFASARPAQIITGWARFLLSTCPLVSLRGHPLLVNSMASPPSPTRSTIPSAIVISRPQQADTYHPQTVGDQELGVSSRPEPVEHYDYTGNAPQAVVDAIAMQRAREEKEAPPDMMVGSFQSWGGLDEGASKIVSETTIVIESDLNAFPEGGIYPSSITRTPLKAGSRRASVASRRSGSFGPRPSVSYGRHQSGGSQVDLITSPSSGVFHADSEDDEAGPSIRSTYQRMSASYQSTGPGPRQASRRHDAKRGRQASSTAQGSYFAYQPDRAGPSSNVVSPGSPVSPLSPNKPTTFGKLASYIGFNRPEDDEESGLRTRRRRSGSEYSARRSGTPTSGIRSLSPSSSEDWGYKDEDDDDDWEARGDAQGSYTSSLADDTSLPPQSRPHSPHLPLMPNSTDAVFGESGRGLEDEEPKDFVSVEIPSRQTVILPDEDLSIRFTGYRTDTLRRSLWLAGCVVTLGGLGLLGRWTPSIWVRFCGEEVTFEDAKEGSWLMVEVSQDFNGMSSRL